MHTIVFDVSGPYGHFRKPYAPVSPVTYPFPPPPTVLGLIGAILGYGKEEYLSRIGWEKVRVGVRLLKPTRKYRTGLNLVLTHEGNKYFRLVPDSTSRATRGQYPYEFLLEPAFRIYIAEAIDEAMQNLESQLQAGRTVYTPSLGLAQCIADVAFVGVFEGQPLSRTEYNIASVVPDPEENCRYEKGRRYVRYRVPAQMQPDRTVVDYREVVVAEDGSSITVETDQAYEIGDDHILFF